jgi:proline iminopeptidase
MVSYVSLLPVQSDFQLAPVFRDAFIAPIPEAERKDIVLAYHAQLNSVDEETRLGAAKAWSKWE